MFIFFLYDKISTNMRTNKSRRVHQLNKGSSKMNTTTTSHPGSAKPFTMRMQRFLSPLLVLAGFTASAGTVHADEAADKYPSRPITFVVPSPPGGTTDVVTRIAARKLGEKLGQSVIVENRAGANGYIGTQAVLRSPKDGYMFTVMSGSLHSFTPAMVNSMPFDPIEDFALVSRLVDYPFALVTAKSSPFNSLPELLAAAKDPNSKLSYGSYGVGSSPHLITELVKLKTGAQAIHVPYKGGGQSASDLMSGVISFMFASLPAASSQINGDQVKALALTSATRHESFADIPVVSETIPDFEVTSWLGLAAPKGTPTYATDKIRAALLEVSQDPEYVQAMQKMNASVKVDESAESFHQYMVSELDKWNAVVKAANIPKQDQ